MRVLVACEYSGRVRDAFRAKGHDAWSCDLRESEDSSPFHIQCDVREILLGIPAGTYRGGVEFCDLSAYDKELVNQDILDEDIAPWDMLIAHPECKYNTLAGVRWMYHPEDTHLPAAQRRRHPQYPDRMDKFLEGVEFFNLLKSSSIPKICIENSQPHGLAMQHIGKYTQIVQPWMFGEPYTKGAALWLIGLPPLVATHAKTDYDKIIPACHHASPGPDRERERSRTYQSIANAMAEQWG